MAFNNYPYNGYQSPYYSQPMPGQMEQQMRQGQPQPMPMQGTSQPNSIPIVNNPILPQSQSVPNMQFGNTNMNSSGILWIRNRDEALAWPVAPNNAVALWDMSAPFVYLKQADATGKPTITPYELVDRSQDVNSQSQSQGYAQNQPQEASTAPLKLPEDYVTKDDIKALQERIDELERQIKEQEVVYVETPAEAKTEAKPEIASDAHKSTVRSKRVSINKGE